MKARLLGNYKFFFSCVFRIFPGEIFTSIFHNSQFIFFIFFFCLLWIWSYTQINCVSACIGSWNRTIAFTVTDYTQFTFYFLFFFIYICWICVSLSIARFSLSKQRKKNHKQRNFYYIFYFFIIITIFCGCVVAVH